MGKVSKTMKKRRLRRGKTRRIGGEGMSQENYNNLPDKINTKFRNYNFNSKYEFDPKLSYYDRPLAHLKLPKDVGNNIITRRQENKNKYNAAIAERRKTNEAQRIQTKKEYNERIEAQKIANLENSKKTLTQQQYNELQPNEKYKWKRGNPQSNSTFFSPKYTYLHKTRAEILEWKVGNDRNFVVTPEEYELLNPKLRKLFSCERRQVGMQEWEENITCRRI